MSVVMPREHTEGNVDLEEISIAELVIQINERSNSKTIEKVYMSQMVGSETTMSSKRTTSILAAVLCVNIGNNELTFNLY